MSVRVDCFLSSQMATFGTVVGVVFVRPKTHMRVIARDPRDVAVGRGTRVVARDKLVTHTGYSELMMTGVS